MSCLPGLRQPPIIEDEEESYIDDDYSNMDEDELDCDEFDSDFFQQSHKEPSQQCFTAKLIRNAQNETLLVSSSGNEYRFLDVIKRSIFGQVVRAERINNNTTIPSSNSTPMACKYRRDRGDSISTHTTTATSNSDSSVHQMDLSMDDHDFLQDDSDGSSPSTPIYTHKSTASLESRLVAIKIYSRSRIHSPTFRQAGCKEDPSVELEITQFFSQESRHFAPLLGAIECCANEEYIFNVMPFVPHPELFDYLAAHQRFSESTVRSLARQLFQGLSVLHAHHIAHRDISLENLLYDPCQQQITIIDFGLSVVTLRDAQDRIFLSSEENKKYLLKQQMVPNIFTGKVNYLPPEVLAGEPEVNPYAADVWAAGICLLYLLLGFPPLVQAHVSDLRYVFLAQGRFAELINQWQIHVSQETLSFILYLLACDPLQRPSIDEILSHPWLR